ncbi:ASST-domain-containing protein [Mycena filopes]|nr:ASST-domain-containing protein [Mycena filopes]
MSWSTPLSALTAGVWIPCAYALFETTYHSSSLAIQPFTILERSPTYDPDNSTLFLVCPEGANVVQPGPTIYTSTGDLVWADPTLGPCSNLNFQTFEGKEHLTLWFNIPAPGKTALLTAYHPVPLDLTSVGGSVDGWYLNSIFQEVDIDTGRVLFNWSSVDHIALNESFNNLTASETGTCEANAWDAVHINSIDKDSAGNYLISARHSKALYKIDKNGTIIWRLGGRMSDFTPEGNETFFNWQHHARWRYNETQISFFDDGAAVLPHGSIVNEIVASGKFLNVDQDAMTVSLAKRYLPSPSTAFSLAEGSTEPYGNTVVVGYGVHPWVTVHDADTQEVIFSAVIGPNATAAGISTYRVFQTSTHAFTGKPTQPPSVAVLNGTVYVSWNGATHVVRYILLTGSAPGSVGRQVASARKSGFETKINAAGSGAYIRVEALAADGTCLGKSAVYDTTDGGVVSA